MATSPRHLAGILLTAAAALVCDGGGTASGISNALNVVKDSWCYGEAQGQIGAAPSAGGGEEEPEYNMAMDSEFSDTSEEDL